MAIAAKKHAQVDNKLPAQFYSGVLYFVPNILSGITAEKRRGKPTLSINNIFLKFVWLVPISRKNFPLGYFAIDFAKKQCSKKLVIKTFERKLFLLFLTAKFLKFFHKNSTHQLGILLRITDFEHTFPCSKDVSTYVTNLNMKFLERDQLFP